MGLIPASRTRLGPIPLLRSRPVGTTGKSHACDSPVIVVVAWHLGDGELVTGLAALHAKAINIALAVGADADQKATSTNREITPASGAGGQVEAHHRAGRRGVGRGAGSGAVGQPHGLIRPASEVEKVIRSRC